MTDEAHDIPHLRQIDEATVEALCDRATMAAPESYLMRLEVAGFRESRTPWDATRLANALEAYNERDPTIAELIADLDAAAEQCAGLAPSNRHARRL